MSLFIRLETSFWTHRKTIRLRAILGDSALWLPPRLWSYAAGNQPDGDFSKYLPDELALLLAYAGNPQAMLEALQQCGFMDGMKLHGWEERNSYHTVFAERAKKAADARWGKEKDKKKRREEKRQALLNDATSNASSTNKNRMTLEECKNYAKSLGVMESDGEACFHKWEGNGWTNNKAPIKDAKATMRSWKQQGYLPSQKGGNGAHPPRIEQGLHGPIKIVE